MMLNVDIFSLIFFVNIWLVVDCEIFSAIDELENLAVDEEFFIEELQVLAYQLNSNYIHR